MPAEPPETQARIQRNRKRVEGVLSSKAGDYLCWTPNNASGSVAAGGDRGRWVLPIPATTILGGLRRGRDLPTFAACESAQICRREPALPRAKGANCNWTPSQSHTRLRSRLRADRLL